MKSNLKSMFPLLISGLLALATLAITLSTDYTINTEHYIGFGALALSSLLYSVNKIALYRYVFAITLVAGLIGLLDFFYATFKIGIGIISVNPLFILLLILFLVLSNYGQKSKKKT